MVSLAALLSMKVLTLLDLKTWRHLKGNGKRWSWTNRQGVDPEGPCIWFNEELQKALSREGTSDLCSDDNSNNRQLCARCCAKYAIHDLIESTLYKGGIIYPHFTEEEIEA